MKNLFLSMLFFISIFNIYSQEINFIKQGWETARKSSKEKNKYIFMDAYTNWCSWCKVMDKQTFTDSSVIEFMTKNFVPLKMEMETGFGITLAMKYRVTGFPTFLVFNPEGKLVYRIVGFQKSEEFIIALKNALNKEKQLDLKGVTDIIEPGFPDLYKKSYGKGTEKIYPDSASVIKFLEGQNDLFSEVSWAVYTRFKSGTKYHENFLNNMSKYTELFGKEEVNTQLQSLIYREVEKGVKAKNEQQLDVVLSMVDKYIKENKDATKSYYKITYYQGLSDWLKYTVAVDDFISKSSDDIHASINEYAWNVFENSEDPSAIKTATKWMKNMTEKHPEYAYLDTYASLLLKNKDYDNAEKIAIKAIEKGKASDQKVGDTEELLNRIKKAKARNK